LEDLEGGVASQKKEGERNIKPEAEMDAFKKLLAQVESKGLANGQMVSNRSYQFSIYTLLQATKK